jgi:hypothetical protein
MSQGELSRETRALLRSARTESPSPIARAQIWSGVATAAKIAGGAGAAAAGGSAAVGGASAKLLAWGALFGSTVTVGLALVALRVAPAATPGPAAQAHLEIWSAPSREGAGANESAGESAGVSAGAGAGAGASASASAGASAHAPARAPSRDAAEDPLMREASLVAEARSALARADAAGALRAVRLARRLPSHQLEPEELALEAQALRALGRATEATAADGALKSRYPDHALAR